MKSISIYLEYLLIFIISLSTFFFIYNFYEKNKTEFTIFFLNKEEEIGLNKLNNYIKRALNFYEFVEDFNLKLDGYCINNYTIFKRKKSCYPKILEIKYSGDLININGEYYFYSNITEKYFLVKKKNLISFEGCYENKISYIIISDICSGACVDNCNVLIEKVGKKINIYLK